MFIPFNTDAPLYHKPIGTIALIVLNCFAFGLLVAAPHNFDTWALSYGHGLTPLNWVTSNFVHANIGHLIGNMIFLWSFGLIVEGKLGWALFLPLYFGIGASECVVEQLLFWNGSGISCGASAVIFGLMAICLIWAPRNELSIFYVIGIRPGVFEISIVLFSLLTLGKSIVLFQMVPTASNELLHLFGAALGAFAGFAFLKLRYVDCEGWDLISVMTGNVPTGEQHYSWQYQQDRSRRLNRKFAKRKKNSSVSQSDSAEVAMQALSSTPSESRFSELVAQGKGHAAFTLLTRIRQIDPGFCPTEDELLTLSRALRRRQEWNSSRQIYQELIQRYPENIAGRLEFAEILTFILQRPSAARRLIAELKPETLTPKQATRHSQLSEQIDALIQSGVLEIREQ